MCNSLSSTWKSRSDSGEHWKGGAPFLGVLEGGAPSSIPSVFSQHTLSDHSALELASGTTENIFSVSRSVVHFGDVQSCGVSMGSHLGILGRGAIVHQSFAV